MLGLALAVAASAAWGSADFLGGRTASGLSPLRVAVWSKVAGGTMVALLCLLIGTLPTAAQAPWAAAAGLVGAGALLALYHALSLGPMSLVAPLSACGAVVPVVVALARGELPGPVTSAGLACAFAGALLVARSTGNGEAEGGLRRDTLAVALTAALLIGVALTLLQQAARSMPDNPGSVLGIGVVQTAVTVLVLAALAASRRAGGPPAGRAGLAVATLGMLDVSANLLFATASSTANHAAVAVLGSLYPVTTVLLARSLLGERLSGVQATGVAGTLLGVALIGLGG
jgi:drug/metabolite transporter (DMT)-like permease